MFYYPCMNINFSSNPTLKNPAISFQRKLREDEKPQFERTMNEAFDYLGVENRALIVHGSSFPSQVPNKKIKKTSDYYTAKLQGNNPFIGTPYLSQKFLDFVKLNGFNSVQLGPNGKLNKRDNSPYHASVFAKNELFLNFDSLKNDDYANILSDKDFNDIEILKPVNKENYEYADFDEAKAISKVVTNRAYKNFVNKLSEGDLKAEALNEEFNQFKEENDYWLEKDSVFRLFSDIHGSDNFESWDNELDKNIISRMNEGDAVAIERYNHVKNKPGSEEKIDEYKFVQFLIDKQEKK